MRQKLDKPWFVVVGDRDMLFAEHDPVPFDHLDLFRLYDKGTVYADKTACRQHLFQRFHAHQRKDGMRFVLDKDLDIVFQPFDVEYLAQFDLYLFIFSLDEDRLDLCCRYLHMLVPCNALLAALRKSG